MKRNLLAIAIPALLVAGAANASIEVWNKDGNKLSVNGRVKAVNYIGDRDNSKDGEGDDSSARLGFTGEAQITDGITGYGRAEWETKTGGDSFKETRYAFAGINFGQFGSVDYGRNDGVTKAITAYTDVLPEFGGDASNNAWYVLSGRTDAVLTYRNSDFFGVVDGLSFAVQYADSDNTWDVAGNHEVGKEAYGLNIEYAILDTGLTAGAAYATTSKAGDDERMNTYMAGLKYDANDLYLAAMYAYSKYDDEKVKGFELVAQYGFDFEIGRLTPSIAYVQHKGEKIELAPGVTGTDYAAKYVEVGVQYDFNKNLSAIVDYKINLLDDNKDFGYSNADTKDTLGLALIYQF